LGVPRLSPDLSATTYGARLALAEMAKALGKVGEADRWTQSAADIRGKILEQLYVAEDAAFYDLDANGKFVRVRGDILTRVCGERIPDQALFDTLWERQIHNPKAFWATYPLPSIAVDDPTFVRPIPKNSWGGPSQALTALRAPRWMDHYGRSAEFSGMMTKWCEAIIADMTFRQQIDPVDGSFTKQGDEPDYSPCALVMIDYSWRLAGVVEEADTLAWNVRPGHPASVGARFRLPLDGGGSAEMVYDGKGAELRLAGRRLGRIDGTARLVTRKDGQVLSLRGIDEAMQKVVLRLEGRAAKTFKLAGNQVTSLA
jgi:hypothetical protein